MGGVRQFTSLLRKNVLLKTRRPCATCFEIALPLVLFMLLVFVRHKVDDKSYGPFVFDHHEIFPLSSIVARELTNIVPGMGTGPDVSRAKYMANMSKVNSTLKSAHDGFNFDDRKRRIDMLIALGIVKEGTSDDEAMCQMEGPLADMMSDVLRPMMSMKVQKNRTFANYMLHANASYEGDWARTAVEEMQAWNVSGMIAEMDNERRKYLSSDWPKMITVAAQRVDLEISRLRAELNSNRSNGTRQIVEGWVGDVCDLQLSSLPNVSLPAWKKMNASKYVNASSLAKELANLQKVLENCGIADWINGTSGSELWRPLRSFLDSVSTDDVANMTQGFAESLRDLNAESTAELVDDGVWWLSHFVRSRSMLARFLGEERTENSMLGTDASMDALRASMGRLPGMGMAKDEGLRTSMASSLYRSLKTWQKGGSKCPINDPKKLSQNLTKDWTKMSKMVNRDGLKGAESIMSDLKKMMAAIRNRNATDIVQNVLPKWNKEWQAECPKLMNKTAIGTKFQKMQSKCPFYRRQLRSLAEKNLSHAVRRMHQHLSNTTANTSLFRCPVLRKLLHWHNELRHKVNATKVGADVRRMILDAQSEYSSMAKDLKIPSVAELVNATNTSEQVSKYSQGLSRVMMRKFFGFDKASYNRIQKGCVQGHNLAKYSGKSIQECVAICDAEPKCVAFEYGAAHGGVYGATYKVTAWSNAQPMECRTQDSADPTGCDGGMHNLDLYIANKPGQAACMATGQLKGRKLAPKKTKQYDDVFDQLQSRKILVAPYKGEAKELLHLMFVEFAHSMSTTNDNSSQAQLPKEFQALMRCPIIKAGIAKFGEYFMKERMLTFDSEEALEVHARDHGKEVLIALVFRNADAAGNFPKGQFTVDYSLRAHAQFLPQTSKIIRFARSAMFGGVRRTFYPYIDLYFAHLQEMMGRSVARMRASRDPALAGNLSEVGRNIAAGARTESARKFALALQQYPAQAYKVDRFIRVIQHTLPMFMILGWIYAVALLVKEMVYEKQEKLRDVMRIQGLKTWVYWSSWVASAMIQMTVLIAMIVCILCGGGVFRHSDPSLVFVFFWTYSLATVSFSMFISSFFSRAKVAAACAGLVYYLSYLPYGLFNRFEDVMSIHGKNAICLLSSTGMGIGSAIMAKWELVEEGVNWSNFAKPPPVTNSGATPADNFSLAHVMMMLLVDTIVYQVLAWYIEKVYPGTLGLPQPWYFPFMRSYWRGVRDAPDMNDASDSADSEKDGNRKIECWEAPPSELDVVVKIRKLVKTFGGGKRALKGICLDMHRGTILGLLGHNGAGKTTTMSILTGLYPPTAGDVHVNGRSVRKDSHGVRRQLGVCLQHNALYECISVEEHLSLFCCLKSVPWNEMKSTVSGLLDDIGLMAKRTAPSKALSGGMKRKLSIGIALSGGSQVVTLDEPTAGVDATSRRDIWHLLASQKSHRTILLSTHFMDEADILSDRIAIIAEGELTAIGSGMALKGHFADKYMLTLVSVDGADAAKLTQVVCRAVPMAKFSGSRGRELSYSLPGSGRSHFANLFAQLQDAGNRAMLGIEAYGLSAASMEEVFLQASSIHEEGLDGTVRNLHDSATNGESSPPPQLAAEGSDIVSTTSGSISGDKSDSSKNKSEEVETTSSGDRADMQNSSEEEVGPQCVHSMTAPLEQPKDDSAIPDWNIKAPKEVVKAIDAEQVIKEPSGDAFNKEALWYGPRLWQQQFWALFRKRALSVRRDRKAWASQLLLPVIFIMMALIMAAILVKVPDEPPLKLSTDMLIGTTMAGAVSASLPEHTMPWSDMRQDDFSKKMLTSFQNAKGAGDKLIPVDVGRGKEYSDVTDYLLRNNKALLMKSYGAVQVGGSATTPNVTMWFRARAYHAVPMFTNLFNNARFKMLGFGDTKLNAWSHPLPKSQVVMQEELSSSNQVFIDLTVAITVLLAMGFVPASFVVYLVHEKSTSGKHQQLLTGVSPTMYWMSSYFWDLVNYLCPLIVCSLIFLIFQVPAYSGRNSFAIFMLLLCYGLCMTPLMYCLEPLFSVPSTAYVTLICINIFTGTISVMATAVLDMVQNEEPSLKPINSFCKSVFPWLLPNYSLGRGMIDVASNHYMNYAFDEFGVCVHRGGNCIRDPMAWDVVGKNIMYLVIMTPVWLSLRMFIEWGCCTRRLRKGMALHQGVKSEQSPDEAVNKEAERISAGKTSGGATDRVQLTNLAKTFSARRACCCRKRVPATHAVRGLNLGVPGGECFGLLGVNGAGKTTTMAMITGHTDIGGGDIQVCGESVQNHRDRARRHLGYCPQFDALPDKLTVRETLALYARIRGVPSASVQTTMEQMVKRMCLEAHQHNVCEHLSGGNKRKLSTALALIGEPDVVLLDEPSTGVDVGARRFLWDVIGDLRLRGHALLLTSHSMEECEVLCTRLTIMQHGVFRCLGSPMQLKARYGGGYTLMVKALLSKDADSCRRIRDFIAAHVPDALLAEESVGLFRYGLGGRGSKGGSDMEVPLAKIFEMFEQATQDGGELHGCVSDYTLSQTSLEEVFLHFSREAETKPSALQNQGSVPVVPAMVELPCDVEETDI